MKFSPEEIAGITDGQLEGDAAGRGVTGVNSVEMAGPNDLTFVDSPDKLEQLGACQAAVILLPLEAKGKLQPGRRAFVYVKNPRYAFALMLREAEKELARPPRAGRHPSAFVAPSASVDPGAYIGPNCTVDEDAAIGANAVLEANCFVGRGASVGEGSRLYPQVSVLERCSVGKRCTLHSGVVIGSDGYGYVRVNGRHEKIPQLGVVVIGDDVEIGANTAVDRAALEQTVIGRGTKIDNLVHIAHNVRIGTDCLILGQAGIAGSTLIGDNVIIAGQSGVVDHVSVGNNSVVMGRTGVIADLPEGSVVFGALGRPRREAMRLEALLTKLPEMYSDLKRLKKGSADEKKDS